MTGSANSRRFQLKSSLKKNDGLKAKRRTSSVNSRSGTISSGGAVSRLLTEKERMATVIQFVSTALDSQLKKGNSPIYQKLVKSLLDSDGESMQRWIQGISHCVSHISSHKAHSQLVKTLFGFRWSTLDVHVLQSLCVLLSDMAAVNGGLLSPVLSFLVGNISPSSDELERDHSPYDDPDCDKMQVLHTTIARICNLIPSSSTILFNQIESSFPFYKNSSTIQLIYIKNVLQMARYLPQLRDRILQLVVHHITHVDVSFVHENESVQQPGEAVDFPLLSQLDDLMLTTFDFLKGLNVGHCREIPTATSAGLSESVFGALLKAFENVIIKTDGSQSIQFLILYYCSFDHMFTEILLRRLVEKIFEPMESDIVRISCAHYLSSFLIHANYVRQTTFLHYFELLMNWAESYLTIHEENLLRKESLHLGTTQYHKVFYSVNNAIFAMFAYRPDRFAQVLGADTEDDSFNPADTIREIFSPLAGSSLCPLKFCSRTIVSKFSSVCRQLGYPIDLSFSKAETLILSWPQRLPFEVLVLPRTLSALNGIYFSPSTYTLENLLSCEKPLVHDPTLSNNPFTPIHLA